ncbi:MAG: hypothetical protein EOO72_11300, partial [Myxococcaceae bacterium]
MSTRVRSAIEAELAHVHFLLDELSRWDASDVPPHVRRLLTERYERQARVLLAVLTETPAESLTSTPDVESARNDAVSLTMGEGALAVGPVSFNTQAGLDAEPAKAFVASEPPGAHVATENVSAVASEPHIAHGIAVEPNVVADPASVAHALTDASVSAEHTDKAASDATLTNAATTPDATLSSFDVCASLGVATPSSGLPHR